jgi:hypothetical protein
MVLLRIALVIRRSPTMRLGRPLTLGDVLQP